MGCHDRVKFYYAAPQSFLFEWSGGGGECSGGELILFQVSNTLRSGVTVTNLVLSYMVI